MREDLGDLGDVTSQAVVPDEQGAAALWSKDTGILAGEAVFSAVFRQIDPQTTVSFSMHDGAALRKGDRVALILPGSEADHGWHQIRGKTASLLAGERTALNFISFLSGIATATHSLAALARDSGHAVILDTRKTLPGWRALSKYAVTVGGGKNHRQGLYDMILIKDNHVDAAGSIAAAVRRVRDRWGTRFTVEVECRNDAEVEDALDAGADIIMLDNMDPDRMREEVRHIAGRAKVEASGTMNANTVPAASAAGVDYISVGALTHSVRSFDFSLKID